MIEVFQIKTATWMAMVDEECKPVFVMTERQSDETFAQFCKRHDDDVQTQVKECPPKSEVREQTFFLQKNDI